MSASPGSGGRAPRVRDLDAADLPRLASLEKAIFGASAWSRAVLDADFASGMRRYRGIDADGGLVAYAVYGFDGDAFHLMNIAVDPQRQGEGLGGRLLDDFFAEARRLGVGEAWLEVAVTNDAAMRMYQARGFEGVRTRRKYYQPEGTDAIVMRVAIPSD